MPPTRARDLQYNIKEYGFEQGVTLTLYGVLDEYAQTRQHLRELTELVSKCVDEVSKMISVGDAMKLKIEQINRDRQQGERYGEREG